MQIKAVITCPVQFTPGLPDVLIPFEIVSPSAFRSTNLDACCTTQSALGDGNWGDEQCRDAVASCLLERFDGMSDLVVTVLTSPEYTAELAANAAQSQNVQP